MQIPPEALRICQTLRREGYEAFLVGGAIRDFIMGREAHDWDIATNARPEVMLRIFPRVILTGIQHGTVTAIVDGTGFEVTTYRGDGDYTDGRRPDAVSFLDRIEDDLARRDFTMNAIAYDPIDDRTVDPFGGMADIANKVIRAVGDPRRRFHEDGLRVMRAARFAATLGFSIEPETLEGIRPNLEVFSKVSIERVHDELFKIMKGSVKPSVAFRVMAETGMLEVFIPEFKASFGCAQNKYHAFDVWEHTLVTLDRVPATKPLLRFAALFHDIGKPAVKEAHPVTGDATFYNHEVVGADMTREILTRLRFATEDLEAIVHFVRHHYIRYEADHGAPAVRRWVRKVGLDNVPDFCTLAHADIDGKGPAKVALEETLIDALRDRVARMSVTETIPTSTKVLVINGRDVMEALGIAPGPRVGRVLNALLESVTDDPSLNERETLLRLAKEIP